MTNVINKFSISFIQFLTEQGQRVGEWPSFTKDINLLLDLYRWMVFTRTFDAKAIALQRTGKMGTFPSSLGQEAISIGIGSALQQEDVFVPYYRDQGTLMMRGVKPSQIFAYWGGDERGSLFSEKNKEDLPICVPIATQLLHAAGIAYAIKLRKETRAVLTTCGDGGTSEGDFYEAINFAGNFTLPLVFVVNNNQWAISVPRGQQTKASTLAQKAIAGGFEGLQVDGNDIIAVRYAVSQALEKAKRGDGPTLIEAITYRLCDHTTADDAKRYTQKTAWEEAWKKEPINRLKLYLENQGVWTSEKEEELLVSYTRKIAKAVKEYENVIPQPATALLDYLYENLPIAYQTQWEELSLCHK